MREKKLQEMCELFELFGLCDVTIFGDVQNSALESSNHEMLLN